MSSKKTSRLARAAKSMSASFELHFEKVARDPRVLAFMAHSVNRATNLRVEALKLQSEISYFKGQMRLHLGARSRDHRP